MKNIEFGEKKTSFFDKKYSKNASVSVVCQKSIGYVREALKFFHGTVTFEIFSENVYGAWDFPDIFKNVYGV